MFLLLYLSRLPELPFKLVDLVVIIGFSPPSNFGFLHLLLRGKVEDIARQANLPIAARYSDNPTPILKEDSGFLRIGIKLYICLG